MVINSLAFSIKDILLGILMLQVDVCSEGMLSLQRTCICAFRDDVSLHPYIKAK